MFDATRKRIWDELYTKFLGEKGDLRRERRNLRKITREREKEHEWLQKFLKSVKEQNRTEIKKTLIHGYLALIEQEMKNVVDDINREIRQELFLLNNFHEFALEAADKDRYILSPGARQRLLQALAKGYENVRQCLNSYLGSLAGIESRNFSLNQLVERESFIRKIIASVNTDLSDATQLKAAEKKVARDFKMIKSQDTRAEEQILKDIQELELKVELSNRNLSNTLGMLTILLNNIHKDFIEMAESKQHKRIPLDIIDINKNRPEEIPNMPNIVLLVLPPPEGYGLPQENAKEIQEDIKRIEAEYQRQIKTLIELDRQVLSQAEREQINTEAQSRAA